MDLDRAWDLHPQVSVRPEPFGALLYHFGTRKLSFLKDRTLLTVVGSIFSRRLRRALLAAAVADVVVEYARLRPELDPVRFGVARRLDDLAYGAGEWFSAARGRSVWALLPSLRVRG